MTTVAYDGTTLATDSRSVGYYVDDAVKKLFEVDGVFYGFAGGVTDIASVIQWLQNGGADGKPEIKEEDVFGIEVNGDDVFYWEKNLVKIPRATPCAVGSGAVVAMTAMLCGKNAVEAVEMAKILDQNTGGDVQSVNIRGVDHG